ENVLDTIECYSAEVIPAGKITLENLKAVNQTIPLNFTLLGKDDKAQSSNIGIDALVLEPVREYIPEWAIIGPFPNERRSEEERLGLETVYPPEKEIDLDKMYIGADSQKVSWKIYQTPASGRFQLWDKVKPYELVVTYAFTYVYSQKEQTLPLLIGSDDGVKVFLNDKPVHSKLLVRISAPDQDTVPLNLKKGWNKLLLKIENNFGGYAFFARVKDLDNTLIFSPTKGENDK
ncbi:MAG: hypothetical protein JXL67_06915, partial [Calditrichaeota bacterium]|nr:hypothetical protein [Calditrichota bacterium]